ncbi:MAG: large ribosomal subunit protein bL35 [Candidatus Saccharimonadales bacterium]
MPKIKSHSGTKDRVRISKNGKVRIAHPNMNHFLGKKSGARKRRLSGLQTRGGKIARDVKRSLGV